MKTLVSILLCTLLFSGNEVYSQQDSLNKKITYIIKTDLFFPVISFMARQTDNINQYGQSLTFETGFNQRQSFQITGLLMSFKGHENSWQVIPEYKFFFSKKQSYKGFYCSAYLKYITNKITYSKPGPFLYCGTGLTYPIVEPPYIPVQFEHGFAEGINLGYQTYYSKHLVIDFLIGFGKSQIKLSTINSLSPSDAAFSDRFALNLGYKF